MHRGQSRLRYLDGLRGLAALMVVLWHYLGPTYTAYLPYGDRYAGLPLVGELWMGVEIFFLISGFVIFMTIERCSGFVDFMLRRWLRLFPTMLVASCLLFLIDRLFHWPGPEAGARWIDLIPGLTFIPPAIYHAVLHRPIDSIDGVFWTLYVEMAFYVVFGLLYFRFGWKRAIAGLVLLFVAVRLWRIGLSYVHLPLILARAVEPFEWWGVDNFGWFAAGALFYKAHQADDRRLFALAVSVSLLSVALFNLAVGMSLPVYVGLIVVALFFAAVQRSHALQSLFAIGPMIFLGFVSYPLYLLHNNLGIGALAIFGPALFPHRPDLVIPLVMAMAILLAWVTARFAEPWLTARLRPVTDAIRDRLGAKSS
ncbi:acyltransferase [Sphingomonas sp. AP4-R1]|uniref:acyltransferase family protein n=1 Tax=Sphingomonas sp. AP4-R1 TaxID=2735134 RepID=UPI0014939307|nr:acyltransferase [Sphingomonas sp. AP4-R1]QJU58612.1 acyltransferase [Sphingomonas sp. AP4-R1]